MKTPSGKIAKSSPSGVALMEAVIAIGLLAFAVPLIFGSMAESGNSAQASSAETRAPWIVRACLKEIHAARNGTSPFFPDASTVPDGEVRALAFSESGELIDGISPASYASGLRTINDRDIRYIGAIRASTAAPSDPKSTIHVVQITIEFPAAAPQHKRRTLDFHTRIP